MSYYQLVAVAILGWGVGAIFYKIANNNISPLWVEMLATMVYLIVAPMYLWWFKPAFQINTVGIVFSILGALTMCAGSLAYFFLLSKYDAGEITAITSLYPAITMFLSFFFLKEDLSLKKIIGLGLALAGVYLLSKK